MVNIIKNIASHWASGSTRISSTRTSREHQNPGAYVTSGWKDQQRQATQERISDPLEERLVEGQPEAVQVSVSKRQRIKRRFVQATVSLRWPWVRSDYGPASNRQSKCQANNRQQVHEMDFLSKPRNGYTNETWRKPGQPGGAARRPVTARPDLARKGSARSSCESKRRVRVPVAASFCPIFFSFCFFRNFLELINIVPRSSQKFFFERI